MGEWVGECSGAFRLGVEQASEAVYKKGQEIVYLVIIQKQRSSAKIKFIPFSMDITAPLFLQKKVVEGDEAVGGGGALQRRGHIPQHHHQACRHAPL